MDTSLATPRCGSSQEHLFCSFVFLLSESGQLRKGDLINKNSSGKSQEEL